LFLPQNSQTRFRRRHHLSHEQIAFVAGSNEYQ
jgi:hypothetical protein